METVNCQTVTLGIDDIDLSCDMMKNKAQKTWNISLLFVYLQRTMVQIQKLIFHILKDFKEAVCEYRLFFYLYYRLQRNFRVLRVIRGFFLGSLKARCFGVAKTE